jgi:hypothetical protein
MLLFLIIAAVLIGLAYADYCLIDNTEHFGICFSKAAEVERERAAELKAEALPAEPTDPWDELYYELYPEQEAPAAAWLLQELEPVLELHEQAS